MSAGGQGAGTLKGQGQIALEEEHEQEREMARKDSNANTAVESGEREGGSSGKGKESEPMKEAEKEEKTIVDEEEVRARFWNDFQVQVHDVAKMLPLLAAVAAPISTLLDIPALTETWYLYNGLNAPDPRANLALSSLSLSFNIIANAFLVARFTCSEKRWRMATIISVTCWIIKVGIALVNLGIYGADFRNDPAYTYSEGFWCAVGSAIVSGSIMLVLVAHYALRYDKDASNGALIRVAGAEFMLVVMAFVSLLALQGLIFSRIEDWTFFQGVYFSLVTAFTIGFGDFEPTHTSSRILLFPFAVLSIAMLAVQIGVLIDFITSNTTQRKSALRKKIERKFHKSKKGGEKRALVEEVALLQEMERREENWDMAFKMLSSTISLVGFWLIGGAVFMAVEGWAFGTAMYFCYVFFLTIGYGDFAPITAGGRVFFVLWSILSVPVVTNFVLSTVSGLISSLASTRFQKARDHRAPTNSEQRTFHSHAHNVSMSAQRLDHHFDQKDETPEGQDSDQLARIVLGLAIRMEAEATSLLLELLEKSSKEQILLQADRNLQLRALRQMMKDGNKSHFKDLFSAGTLTLEEDMQDEIEESENVLDEFLDPASGKKDTLEMVRRYRETCGGLFAAGSRLMNLDGKARLGFERRLEGEEEADKGGLLLGSGRKGDAEIAYGVDV